MDWKALSAERRKTYAESVQRTNRFVISTLTILLILVVIVQQELVTAKFQAKKLRREVVKATERLDQITQILAYQFLDLQRLIHLQLDWEQIAESPPRDQALFEALVSELSLDEIQRISGRAVPSADELKEFEPIQKRIKDRLEKEVKKDRAKRDPRLINLLEEVARQVESYKKVRALVVELQLNEMKRVSRRAVLTLDELKQIERIQTRVTERLQEEAKKEDKKARDTRSIIFLEELARVIKPYRKTYQDCLALGQSALTKQTQLQAMRTAKQAIPTPFGNFQVPPNLAFMALAFAAVLGYLFFIMSVFRLRAFAREYLRLGEGEETLPLDRAPPLWLYGRDSRIFSSLFSNPKVSKRWAAAASLGTSFLIHAGWLVFAAWLVYESWTWKSSAILLFENKHIPEYVLLLLMTLAVVLFLILFLPLPSREPLFRIKPVLGFPGKNLTRRAFLGGSLIFFIAGAAYYFGFRGGRQRVKRCTPEADPILLQDYKQDFVTNRRTRILHHSIACRNHLPRLKNRESNLAPNQFCLHKSYASRIWEETAARDVLNERYEPAIAHLRKAIEMSPFSYHLYDRLIGLYGRLRQYDEIGTLLQGTLQRVRIQEQNISLKQRRAFRAQKQMERAEKEFQVRYQTYSLRRTKSSSKKRDTKKGK